MYTVATAQLPEPPAGADRIFIAPNAVVVLDGASAFNTGAPDAAAYVDTLGGNLVNLLTAEPTADLRAALALAISTTAATLALTPGRSPSSTAAIARWTGEVIDLLVLGDTQITTPRVVLRDDRIRSVARAERAAYRDRLRRGHGYDGQHKLRLSALQAEQEARRNRADGYWIAEAAPQAANHAFSESLPVAGTPWLIIATDGAYGTMQHLELDVPSSEVTDEQLARLLRQCEDWESQVDPNGQHLIRAKQHDDKTIAVLRSISMTP